MKNQEDVLAELDKANQQVVALNASMAELKGQLSEAQSARARAEDEAVRLKKQVDELQEHLVAKERARAAALAEAEKKELALKSQGDALSAELEKKVAERLAALGIAGSGGAQNKPDDKPQVGRLTLAALQARGFKTIEEALAAPVKL